MTKCPWCGQEAEMVKIAYLTEREFLTKDVCAACRKKFMKRLKESVGGRK